MVRCRPPVVGTCRARLWGGDPTIGPRVRSAAGVGVNALNASLGYDQRPAGLDEAIHAAVDRSVSTLAARLRQPRVVNLEFDSDSPVRQHPRHYVHPHADLPPVEAASASGFADQSHLGRWFRRAYGLTPAAYRRICTNLPD